MSIDASWLIFKVSLFPLIEPLVILYKVETGQLEADYEPFFSEAPPKEKKLTNEEIWELIDDLEIAEGNKSNLRYPVNRIPVASLEEWFDRAKWLLASLVDPYVAYNQFWYPHFIIFRGSMDETYEGRETSSNPHAMDENYNNWDNN